MFTLKKILTLFLLPPGIFIVILIFSGIWFLSKRYHKAGILNLLIGAAIWVSSISPVSDALSRGLESNFKIPENPKGDVIILLGGGIYDGAPDLSGVGSPKKEMLGRIITAVRLQKRLNVPIIVSGGKVYEHIKAEAPLVGRFLTDLGVPARKIILEDKGRDTFENAKFSKELCKKYGFKNPILITSAIHMKRSILSFKKAGIDVLPFPANFKTWKNKRYGWVDYLPRASKLDDTYLALHEYLGLLFYKFAY